MKEKLNLNHKQPAEHPGNVVALRERIEQRAYHIWLASGRGHGEYLHHRFQAESEVFKEIEQNQSDRSTVPSARRFGNRRAAKVSYESTFNK